MEILWHSGIIVICILVIAQGAAWLVESAARLARRLGMSELVIGLTIVAMGTSAPESGVTILAAIQDKGDISIGNIVGSNIFNLGLILGSIAVFRSLKTNRTLVVRDGFFLLFGTLLLMFFLRDLQLEMFEGGILLGLLFSYIIYIYRNKEPLAEEAPEGELRWWDPPLLLVGMVCVLGGSHFLVESGVALATILGLSEWIIGVTIIAAGTSTPEFATALVAVLKDRHGISVGSLIGSDIFNMYGVLGLAGIIHEMTVDSEVFLDLLVLILMVVLVLIFMRRGWNISRREGIVLISIALARWVFIFV